MTDLTRILLEAILTDFELFHYGCYCSRRTPKKKKKKSTARICQTCKASNCKNNLKNLGDSLKMVEISTVMVEVQWRHIKQEYKGPRPSKLNGNIYIYIFDNERHKIRPNNCRLFDNINSWKTILNKPINCKNTTIIHRPISELRFFFI